MAHLQSDCLYDNKHQHSSDFFYLTVFSSVILVCRPNIAGEEWACLLLVEMFLWLNINNSKANSNMKTRYFSPGYGHVSGWWQGQVNFQVFIGFPAYVRKPDRRCVMHSNNNTNASQKTILSEAKWKQNVSNSMNWERLNGWPVNTERWLIWGWRKCRYSVWLW